jgi:hypothetical protein
MWYLLITIFKSSALAKFLSKNIVRVLSFIVLNLLLYLLHPNQNESLRREKLNYLIHCMYCSVTSPSVYWSASTELSHPFVKTNHIFFFLSLTCSIHSSYVLLFNLVTHLDTYTLCRTALGEESARRRDLYLTTNNTHKRQTSIPPAQFENAIPTSGWPQTHALDRVATGIDVGKH